MDAPRRQRRDGARIHSQARRLGLMAQLRPGFLLGGEARYLRKYEGTGLEELAGRALFCRSNGIFPIVETLAADRKLQRSGVGASGRINCQP